jgi:hypothetical protein
METEESNNKETTTMEKDDSGFYVISALKTASRKPKFLAKRAAKKPARQSKNEVKKNREAFLLNRQAKLKKRDEHVQMVVASHRTKVEGESTAKSLRISEGIKVFIFFNSLVSRGEPIEAIGAAS